MWTAPVDGCGPWLSLLSHAQLYELRVQRDRGVEDLRDRAVLLRFPCDASKSRVVEVGHLASQGESRLADLESLAIWIQRDSGLRGEFRRVETGALQAERQCHREASRM